MACSEEGEDLNDCLLKQLVCPVCAQYCTYPIFMCTNGHNVCHECVLDNAECAVCKQQTPYCRNLFAEEASSKITVLCTGGCEDRYTLSKLNEHLPECSPQVSYDCYIMTEDGTAKCLWFGDSKEALIEHVTENHPDNIFRGNGIIVNNTNFDNSWLNANLFSAYEEIFWVIFHYISDKSSLYAYAYYIGLSFEASKYIATFSFKSEDLKRNVTHKSLCYSYKNWPRVEELAVPLHRDTLSIFVKDEQLECRVKISSSS